MRLVTVAIAATVLAGGAVSAFAAPNAHITDVQFIAANRCLGILSSKHLGTPDAATMKAFIKAQSYDRDPTVYDRADDARYDGLREAGRGGAEGDTALTQERDGLCHSFIASSSTANAGGPTATP
ncbi:MAG TPA: hypothetical protein VGL58_00770 [Caulobacteraceae bacterium]